MYQGFAGLIPGQGTYVGFEFEPQSGCVQRQPIKVCLSVCLSLSL